MMPAMDDLNIQLIQQLEMHRAAGLGAAKIQSLPAQMGMI